jgi:hypothetical protein
MLGLLVSSAFVRHDPRRHREAPERPIVRVDALGVRFAARLGMDKAELEIGFGDFEPCPSAPSSP